MKVYLVRHTSVVWDGSEICYGNTDVAVRDTFEQEATVTKQALSEIHVERAYSSPLTRASMLADFCGYEDAERDDRLREMNFGDWEGLLWADLIKGEDVSQFFLRYIDQPVPGGESQMMQLNRVEEFIMEKKAQGLESILIFCHGGVINCARAMAGEVHISEAFETIPDFGSITELAF